MGIGYSVLGIRFDPGFWILDRTWERGARNLSRGYINARGSGLGLGAGILSKKWSIKTFDPEVFRFAGPKRRRLTEKGTIKTWFLDGVLGFSEFSPCYHRSFLTNIVDIILLLWQQVPVLRFSAFASNLFICLCESFALDMRRSLQ